MAKRILLADDSITIQKVVELTFSDGDYEVTAVNNGTKAIQKLSEMRPDIILSDIIMPEKNGYEVCEYVKSHPEFRGIPVILLTGTFEPFDPDRADKAGCDAVVTKPFESQSLIHKVEELIEHARANAPAGAPASTPAPAPAPAAAPADSPFAAPANNFSTSAFQAQSSDIFGAPSSSPAPAMPPADSLFGEQAVEGATKAFPRMSFDELSKMANEPAASTPPPPPPAPSMPEPSPWDEPPAAAAAPGPAPSAPPPSAPEPSPWDEPASEMSGATKAFPKMSFDELHAPAAASAPPPPPPSAPEPSPWDMPAEPAAPAAAASPEPSSPWDEPAGATGGDTKAFPRMSFEELHQMASTPASAPEPPAAAEELPFGASSTHVPEVEPMPEATPASSFMEPASSGSTSMGDLSEEQIDRIARRVVQLMSDQVVKSIAWEVIPDLAEMVVKERIRQLESEA